MDTNLQVTGLTETQVKNISYLERPAPFKGFCVWADKVVATSEIEPTEQQKADAIAWLQALPTEKHAKLVMAEFNPGMVIAMVNAQLTIAQRNRLIPYMAGLQAYMEYKFEDGTRNFRDAKLSLEDLNSDERVADSELALIKAAILAQGIDLDDF